MPRILNLSALVPDVITVNVVQPDGSVKSYDLKDDIPVDVAVLLMQLDQHFKAADTNMDRLKITEEETTHVVGEIFRHTYPEITDAMVAPIKPSDRMALIQVFFTSLISRYSAQANGTDSSTPTSPPDSEPVTTGTGQPEEAEQPSASLPAETPSQSN